MSIYAGALAAGEWSSKTLPVQLRANTMNLAVTKIGLMYAIINGSQLGLPQIEVQKNPETNQIEAANLKHPKIRVSGGSDFELHVMLTASTPSAFPAGAGELQPRQPKGASNLTASQKFKLYRVEDEVSIPMSEIAHIKGDAAKLKETVKDRYRKYMENGALEHLKRLPHQYTNQSETGILGMPWLFNQTNNYILDRNDAKNYRLRSPVADGGAAALSLDLMGYAQTLSQANGGNPDYYVTGIQDFNEIRQLLESVGSLATFHDKVKFGGANLMYGMTGVMLDPLMPENETYQLDSSKWFIVTRDCPEYREMGYNLGFMPDPLVKAGYTMRTIWELGVFCEDPSTQVHLKNYT